MSASEQGVGGPEQALVAFLGELLAADTLDARFDLAADAEPWTLIRDELNRFLDKLWVKDFQLGAKQEMLEKVVQLRTQEVHEILDKVRSGFLIVLSDQTVLSNYSRSCVNIFGRQDLEGRRLSELMRLSERDRDHFESCYDQVFEDMLPVELTLDQLPDQFSIEGRNYEMEYAPILDDSEHVTKLFVTINDTTELFKAEAENARRLALLEILRQKETFQEFLFETSRAFSAARRAPSEGGLRSLLHTVKGNLGCYALSDLAALVHSLEEGSQLTLQDLQVVEDALRKFLEVHHDVLQLEWPETKRMPRAVEVSRLLPFLEQMARYETVEMRRESIEDFLDTLSFIPVELMVAPLRGLTERVAERLEKEVRLELSGGAMLVDPDRVGPILSNMAHLIRNSIDHGIEEPAERGGKSPQGRIEIMCAETRKHWLFRVSDDGRGIDEDAVVRAAIKRGVVDAATAAAMSSSDRLQLIFAQGVSTKEAASMVSGRGVGSGSLLASVEEAGGKLTVHSRLGRGTSFTIKVPRRRHDEFEERADSKVA